MYWYFRVLKKYAVFTGRARRKEYWMFTLIHLLISFVLTLLWVALSRGEPLPDPNSFMSHIVEVYAWITFLPAWTVQVRRLHDVGQSGWWAFAPFMYTILTFFDFSPEMIGLELMLLIGLFFSVILLVFSVQDSQFGENRYGTTPKGDEL